VKVSPGADDDASGVAAVLAAARVLSQFQFEHTLRFIAFSGEEQGLLGSASYARRAYEDNDSILVALNVDMIGHTETAEGGNTLRIYGTRDVFWILDLVETINDDYAFNYVFSRRTIQPGGGGGSDYYSFLRYGFDAIAFFEYEWNTHMHTARDTIDTVNISYLTKNTGLITGLLASLADVFNQYPSGKIIVPQRGRIYKDGTIIKTLLTEEVIVLDSLTLRAETSPGMYPLNKVEFYYDDKLQTTDYSYPFQWYMDKISLGYHTLEVVIYDKGGGVSRDGMNIFFVNLLRSRSP
jgi:Zn-dependent M28 family amino/carboxypeptidase